MLESLSGTITSLQRRNGDISRQDPSSDASDPKRHAFILSRDALCCAVSLAICVYLRRKPASVIPSNIILREVWQLAYSNPQHLTLLRHPSLILPSTSNVAFPQKYLIFPNNRDEIYCFPSYKPQNYVRKAKACVKVAHHRTKPWLLSASAFYRDVIEQSTHWPAVRHPIKMFKQAPFNFKALD